MRRVYDPDNGGYQDNVVVTAVPMFDPIVTDPIPSATPRRPKARQRRRVGIGERVAGGPGEPVAVTAPQAATVKETSQPVLLDGSPQR